MIVPLAQLAPGRPARVVALPADRGHRLVRLAALGLVRGARVELLQASPALVVRVGATTFAMEPRLADGILVGADGEPP